MDKKVVIAVDESIQAKQAVNYAVAQSEIIEPLHIALHHVQPQISQYLIDEAKKNMKAYSQLQALQKKNADAAQALLNNMKQTLIDKGIEDNRIQTITRRRRMSLDRDLLDSAQENLYDAVVLGHRSLSALQKTFMDSVCDRILQQPASIPIWLVTGAVTSPQNILVAVDGSQSAYRAVDHLAFMLSENEHIKLTFLHVKPKLKDICAIDFSDTPTAELEIVVRESDHQCMDQFFHHALNRLKEAGIGEDRVDMNVVEPAFRIGKVIAEKAADGDFGTIVVGRRGLGRSFFTGSVSNFLMGQLSDRALWVVQ